ncbi:hypothetical protein ACHMW6_14330 [Pseudoduganella sp. UC29_106]|uniref:hypothetical protein n=1 Tax=Pseudoduganella sp. UC29_106 TaxID=3374553 RepID=UPI003756FFDE
MPIYVQHETLDRIPDVFNAEAIWQSPGFSLFSRRPLLRDLLERSPREQRGHAATRCFSHVTLRLPQEDVDDDYHLTRGNRVRELAETLAALHQKDFGDLLGSDQVRYGVTGAEDLAPGEIQICFGHAVYVPSPEEKALFNVSVSRDSAVWKPVCAVYPNQRLALIGGQEAVASVLAPGWPFAGDGAILLVNDGPDSEPVVQVRPKEAFDCSFDASLGAYAIRSRMGGSERLLLKITRAAGTPTPSAAARSARPAPVPPAPAESRPAVWQRRAAAAGDDTGEVTAVPAAAPSPAALLARPGESDATFAPGALQRLTLAALALPRLSRYRDTGAISLEIPFTPTLAIARNPAADRAITLVATDADELIAITDAGRQRVTAPANFSPTGARTLRLQPVPAEMAERYCALLTLAEACSLPLAAGARTDFGRSIAPSAVLRPLDAPWMLTTTQAAAAGAAPSSPDRIGLSRNAFSFEATADGLQLIRQSPTQALYHLNEQLQFVAAIADQAFTIPPGHHVVAGHYVLRFDA